MWDRFNANARTGSFVRGYGDGMLTTTFPIFSPVST